MTTQTIDTLLLIALPASGKSEVRRYMAHLTPDQCRQDFRLGPTVQLDDYPYVHLMHRIDDELKALGGEYIFYQGPREPFTDTVYWGVLAEILNEDYDDLVAKRIVEPASAAEHLFDRLDAATARAGGQPGLSKLAPELRSKLAAALEEECRQQLADKHAEYVDALEGHTVVIEAARGGPQGATMPLTSHRGYQHLLATLSDAILSKAAILYIWVTPEESRRKNDARADPNDPGSILHHGVPMSVMLGEYGCDDIEYLIERSDRPDTVRIETHGKVYYLPIGRFDNRVDKTSFLRKDKEDWTPEEVEAIHSGLSDALKHIANSYFG